MKVLVIGGGGYVGSMLSGELLAAGHQVRIFDRLYFGQSGVKPHLEKVELITGDMRTMKPSVMEGMDAVINVGGISNDPTAEYNPRANFGMNTEATEYSAKLCKKQGIRRYIYASSCSIYDFGIIDPDLDNIAHEETPVQPKAPYSLSKLQGEERLLKLMDDDFSPVILRKGTVFGFSPRMRYDLVVNTFVKDALTTGTITVFGGGEMWRPLVSVRDVARSYLAVLEAPEKKVKGQIFNIVYKNFRISELALRIRETLQKMDINVAVAAKYRIQGIRNYRVSGKKIQQTLDVKPAISIEESVVEMVQKIKEHNYTDFENPIYYNIHWLKCMEQAYRVANRTESIFDPPGEQR